MFDRFLICFGCGLLSMTESAVAQDMPLFHCHFSTGKQVTLSTDQDGVTYAFGRPHSAPELILQRSYDEIEVLPWNGVGGSIWEDLTLTNGDISYRLWGDFDRMTEAHEVSGGILVMRGDVELARLECLPRTVIYHPFAFADVYEEAGYCWDFSAEIWQETCE